MRRDSFTINRFPTEYERRKEIPLWRLLVKELRGARMGKKFKLGRRKDRGETRHDMKRGNTQTDALHRLKYLTREPPMSDKPTDWEELKGDVHGLGFDEERTDEYSTIVEVGWFKRFWGKLWQSLKR